MLCEYPGCSAGPPGQDQQPTAYITHEDNRTRAEVMQDLLNHVNMAHQLPLQQQQLQQQLGQPQVQNTEDDRRPTAHPFLQKRDSIPRPTIEENASESDWTFFKHNGSDMSRGQK